MSTLVSQQERQLETYPIRKLIWKYGIPCALVTLINALYNIVDQIFIGQGVGYLGNSATNVIFPLTTIGLSLGLLFGSGCAAMFSLLLGRGDKQRSAKCVGNAIVLLLITGVLYVVITLSFLPQIIRWFGATDSVYEYAMDYGRIICYGFAFYLISIGLSHMLRADGRPNVATISMLVGCLINCVLDPTFIFVFQWGVKGAAWATIIGQFVSMLISVIAILKLKTVTFTRTDFVLEPRLCCQIMSHGLVDFVLNLSITAMFVVNNNLLTGYGALSVYGSEIPLATYGIMQKVDHIITSISTGMAQGAQPVIGYSYGRGNFTRVRQAVRFTFLQGCVIGAVLSFGVLLSAREILLLFGSESELYMEFGVKCIRTYMSLAVLFAVQTTVSNIFMALGKALQGSLLAFLRNAGLPISAGILLCRVIGVEGVLLEGPVSGLIALLILLPMLLHTWRQLSRNALAQ
jgi:putative MATE family efflux protein